MRYTLAFDIGNTNITVAVFAGDNIIFSDRLISHLDSIKDSFQGYLQNISRKFFADISEFHIVSCSVVPRLSDFIDPLVEATFATTIKKVGPLCCAKLKIDVPDPYSVGADRISNVVAASSLYSRPVLVIDFGTATTFDVVASDGSFQGGIIVPGPYTSMQALLQHTAKLKQVELAWPEKVLGKTTETAMQSGLVRGYLAMVDGLIEQLTLENGNLGKIVACGGLGRIFSERSKFINMYNPDLTLIGLRLIAEDSN